MKITDNSCAEFVRVLATKAPVPGGGPAQPQPGMPQPGAIQELGIKPDVPEGRGYGSLQRTINKTGDTKGLV